MRSEEVYTQSLSEISLGGLNIGFQRTVRVPEGKLNSLPAGLGAFNLYRVEDFKSGCPETWKEQGYFMPMYRQEAMWINFPLRWHFDNPRALIVAAGNINAISGKQIPYVVNEEGNETLDIKLDTPQNYLVIPPQPWLDGWKAEDGKVYQFVAAELGSGETVEGQITGKEEVGGIQLVVFEPKPDKKLIVDSRPKEYIVEGDWPHLTKSSAPYEGVMMSYMARSLAGPESLMGPQLSVREMGLGRGGEINQKIYPSTYEADVWQNSPSGKTVLYLVSSEDFRQITGVAAPPTPVTHEKYQQIGYPWFELHDLKKGDSPGSDIFEKLKPVGDGKKK